MITTILTQTQRIENIDSILQQPGENVLHQRDKNELNIIMGFNFQPNLIVKVFMLNYERRILTPG